MRLPTGTVTFLFTDVEGSTQLWEQYPEQMHTALARHDTLLREVIQRHKGVVFKTVGDAFCAAFSTAIEGVIAALAAQQALLAADWAEIGVLRVRMAVHTGSAEARDGDYFGQTLNRVARLLSIGHGEQVLLSQATAGLIAESLPPGCTLQDMHSHRLKDLQQPEHVWQLLHHDLPVEFPPLRSLQAFANNLPVQTTSFIGREPEMEQVRSRLASTRLLTLTGAGGCGKTRLALQVAAERVEAYPDGVWLVELAALSEGDLVAQSVASALGLREEPGRDLTETVTNNLRTKALLLILDNCEHLVEACARLADTLLRLCPAVKVLATSREALNIAGETTYRVPSLLQPDPNNLPMLEKELVSALTEFDAVRLFLERATSHRADFGLNRQNGRAVAEVCQRLDGIPLAIELAAARVKVLPVEQISQRLDNRFRLLTTGSRTALPRHQTLRALIDWSYELLTGAERSLLCRLSVFAGGWTLEAAESVCSDFGLQDPPTAIQNPKSKIQNEEVLDLLTSLVDKSLVMYEAGNPQARYRLLETVRQYALERRIEAGEVASVRKRHHAYFLIWAETAKSQMTQGDKRAWLERVETEYDNLRAALTWCQEAQDAETELRLAGALGLFWRIRGYLAEGRNWLEWGLQRSSDIKTEARAATLREAGSLAISQGDFDAARSCYAESLAIEQALEDQHGIAASLRGLGEASNRQSDYSAARPYFEEALALYRQLADLQGIADELTDLGNLAWNLSDYATARALHEEALAIYRSTDNRLSVGNTLTNLALAVRQQGEYALARTLLEESLVIRREFGESQGVGMALGALGTVAQKQGDFVAARTFHEEGLEIFRAAANKRGIANSLFDLGKVAWALSDDMRARAHWEAGLSLFRQIKDRWGVACVLCYQGLMALQQSDVERARLCLAESLAIRHELGDKQGIAQSLEGFAWLAVHTETCDGSGERRDSDLAGQRAARLLGSAEALHEQIGAPLSPHEQQHYDRLVAVVRSALEVETFAAAWAEGCDLPLEQAVQYALSEE
jgi:predicted ATPase/class 3 adenylate cyclase